MIQSSEQTGREAAKVHYPELFSRVVMIIHENEDSGVESVGAGVLVNVGDRHFVATAAHCIRRNPRVIREGYWTRNKTWVTAPREVRIIKGGAHTGIDLGFLEVAEAVGPEMSEDQLLSSQSVALKPDWSLHIIGYPILTLKTHDQLRMRTLHKKVFISNVADYTDLAINIHYPKDGYRLENDRWVEIPFLDTPHGYSGGGCFIITETPADVAAFGYRLIGIQSSWYPDSRRVEVIPIQHWRAMVRDYLSSGGRS